MEEIWRKIEGFDNYEVSNKGRVKSLNFKKTGKERVLAPRKHSAGYIKYPLTKGGVTTYWFAHRLVACAFLDNTENKPQVDHINGDRTDNRLENLRWCSNQENCNNPVTIARMRMVTKSIEERQAIAQRQSIAVKQLTMDGQLVKIWESCQEAQRALHISHVNECCQGLRKSSAGFRWEYANEKRRR